MRDNEKEYASRNVQPLVVLAQHPFQLKRPKDLPGWNRWPKEVPAQALFDPLATVSATYGVAFQTQFRGNQCQWSSRPTTFVIDRDGEIRGTYDKLHLFDVDLPTGESWRESNVYSAGSGVVLVNGTPVGKVGLTICYDLRFPGLFARLAEADADVIAVPAAFTVPTGKAHWHVLLRARAIEAGLFIVAAAQVGRHEDGRQTFGHSLVVDPWGEVLLDMGEEQGVGFADVDLKRISDVRARIPALNHRRAIPDAVTL